MNEHPSPRHTIDINLHGVVGIRLINPTARDASNMLQLWGPARPLPDPFPDIVIRFVDRLAVRNLTYLGLNASGFTDEGFYVLDRKRGYVDARIPFEKIGGPCEIVCRSGVGLVPLLTDIIKLTLLKKKYISVHASAFVHEKCGVLVTGWTKGGKSEALFAFANHGASYVGDECVVLSSDGRHMFGIPFPVTIWDWQFTHIPNLMPAVGWQKKILFKGIHLAGTVERALRRSPLKNTFWPRLLDEALPAFKRQLKVVAHPQTIFKNGYLRQYASPDKLFLMLSHSEPLTRVEPCSPMEIVQRMHQSNAYELMLFFEHYRAFKFAFPYLQNDFLEHVDARQRALLSLALAHKEAYKVFHPYPVSFETLFTHMQPFCEKTDDIRLQENQFFTQ